MAAALHSKVHGERDLHWFCISSWFKPYIYDF